VKSWKERHGSQTQCSESIDISNKQIEASAQVLTNAAATATSLALASQQAWPYVTIPNFAERSEGVRELSGTPLVVFSPVVNFDRTVWETYATENQGWTEEGLRFQGSAIAYSPIPADIHQDPVSSTPSSPIAAASSSPVWQMSPVPEDLKIVNFDLESSERFLNLERYVDSHRISAISDVFPISEILGRSIPLDDNKPRSIILQPIFSDFAETSAVVGHYLAVVEWEKYFSEVLHHGVNGVVVVLRNTCGQVYTFVVNGDETVFLGEGDLHDSNYNEYRTSAELFDPSESIRDQEVTHCFYNMDIYPSDTLKDVYTSADPFIYTAVVFAVLIGTALAFYLYEMLVQKRHQEVYEKVARTNAIVSSLFPGTVRDRLLNGEDINEAEPKRGREKSAVYGKQGLKSFLDDQKDGNLDIGESKPIADLFPHTTVMFADISGFTAWSSVREPAQVFVLLETIYQSFDKIARQRRVFKVETVGDCYVAVCGLPEPRKDHAVVMSLFARDCMAKMKELVRELEVTLGPDTADLANRFGLHSGPCTAGVLRGERARFQLFGDTVNTAARMESTGLRNKIHISQETADLLREAGKGHWVEERKDIVVAKGKGALQTYWLNPDEEKPSEEAPVASEESGKKDESKVVMPVEPVKPQTNQKNQRLIDWNCELLLQNLRKVVARRETEKKLGAASSARRSRSAIEVLEHKMCNPGSALSEVSEIIHLPKFEASTDAVDPKDVDLGPDVASQLRDFVSILASLYRDNSFHCFEHASHVTMSVSKLLSRIVAPDVPEDSGDNDMDAALHDYTYGITSDPLTHFAVVLSALIHDVDHRGVPNFVLGNEDPNLAKVYQNKSIAEQNSIDLAWNALMDPSFADLRACIYNTESELQRFRKLLVNTVLATDIFDKELSALRKNRWNKAFSEDIEESKTDQIDRKATIVIEHLIQASDVSHTMQHWHIYRKWNKKLFLEMSDGFKTGRTEKDPAEGWYSGELWFFDNYVIPLAKKLKDCGVFGVASDEYLGYAVNNRREWEKKGGEIVAQWKEELAEQEQAEK